MHIDAKITTTVLHHSQQVDTTGSTKAVTATADFTAIAVDIDIVPVGELVTHPLIDIGIAVLVFVEAVIGENHAKTERVIRLVLLVNVDFPVRALRLGQRRKKQSAWTPTNNRNLLAHDFHLLFQA